MLRSCMHFSKMLYSYCNKDELSELVKSELNTRRFYRKTWIQSKCTCIVTIPKPLAEKYGLQEPCYVAIEDDDGCIKITKIPL